MPVLSAAAGGVEGRSMVEGRRTQSAVCDGGPSPALRAVPLPSKCWGGVQLTIETSREGVSTCGSTSAGLPGG